MAAGFRVILVACLAALFQVTSEATTTYTVGDSSGWAPPSTPTFYSTWAAKQVFQAGDSFVFNFTTGEHTVGQVTKSDYDSCTATGASVLTTGPVTVTINIATTAYYICTISNHCNDGQKIAITTTASPSTTPSSTGNSSSSPPPSSSSVVLVLPLLLVAATFLFF